MTALACALGVLLVTAQGVGEVESSYDKKATFSGFHTYAWKEGHEALDPAVHELIVQAIDGHMAALGFTKTDAASADVLLTYHSVRRTDVDLKNLPKETRGTTAPTRTVGSMVVELYGRGATSKPIWRARTRQYVSEDPTTRSQQVQEAIAALFETYPGRKKGSG